MVLRYKRKPTLQKRKDEYNRSFAKAKKAHGGKIPANFPTFANWKKQLYDKYETKPKKRVSIKTKPKRKIVTTRTKATERELRKNLSYKEIMKLRGRG